MVKNNLKIMGWYHQSSPSFSYLKIVSLIIMNNMIFFLTYRQNRASICSCGSYSAASFITCTYRLSAHRFLSLISALHTTLSLYHHYMCHHLPVHCSSDCSWGNKYAGVWIVSSSGSELLLCISTAGLFEQGQAGQHLGQRQLSVDFVVSRAHVDTVSHLLLLPDHCQDTRGHNSLTRAKSHTTHTNKNTHTHTHTHTDWQPCCQNRP